ncbi:MAG: hypothetical protein AAF449_12920, partial [Myxococcota bacterium]
FARWRHELAAAGFALDRFEDISDAVLGGFGRYIQKSGPRWFRGLDPLAIQATAAAARSARKWGWLGFTMLVAHKIK